MPRTAGEWAPVASSWNPAVANTTIDSSDWNSLLDDITDGLNTIGPAAEPRIVTAAGAVTVTSSDTVVCINKTVGAATTVNLPTAVGQNLAVTIKDLKGDAFTNNITVVPTGAETIDGQANFVMDSNYQAITFRPLPSGAGWFIA